LDLTSRLAVAIARNRLDGKDVVDVSCGCSVTFAVTRSGEGFAWGFGTNRQLTSTEEDDVLVPTAMTGKQIDDRKVVQVAAGGQHTIAVVADK
jgi:regulator of chromosome condensation